MTQKTSKRRTSKVILVVNTALAWGLAFYGVGTNQATAVVAACLALVGSIYGAYMGVGHLDYRRLLSNLSNLQNGPDYVAPPELEGGGIGSTYTGPLGDRRGDLPEG